jgi:hypothetical protein
MKKMKKIILTTLQWALPIIAIVLTITSVFYPASPPPWLPDKSTLTNVLLSAIVLSFMVDRFTGFIPIKDDLRNIIGLLSGRSQPILLGEDLEKEQSLLDFIKQSEEFLLIGHTLYSQCHEIRNSLIDCAKSGIKLKFAFPDPKLIEFRSLAKIYNMTEARLISEINGTIEVLTHVMEAIPDSSKVEVRLLDMIPLVNILIQTSKASTTLRCGLYLYNSDYKKRPYILLGKDHPIQSNFLESAFALWEKCKANKQTVGQLRSMLSTPPSAEKT